ncbi:MAG TPA: rhomboid family intramembrane serine protease [Planctomycetota bacterium]
MSRHFADGEPPSLLARWRMFTLVQRLVVVWVAMWVVSFLSRLSGAGLTGLLALDPFALFGADGWPGLFAALPGVLGYALVHEPLSIWHVAFNALLLWVFGPEAEQLFAGRRFLRFFLVVTLAGAAIHLLLAALVGGVFLASVAGGSGLVSAVLAVNAAVYPDRVLNLIFLRCRMITLFLVLVGLDVLWFVADLSGYSSHVANDVHLAGAGVGWLAAGGLHRGTGPFARFAARRRAAAAGREQRRAAGEERELDRILAKIGSEGMPSLTASERRFLERRSKRRE